MRNRVDGTVEASFVGPDDVVADMVTACNQGPRYAVVTHIAQSEVSLGGEEEVQGFKQRPTI